MNKYNLKTPFFCLAPMANITTYPFASQAVKFGADLVWTPMIHSDTVIHNLEEALKIIDFKELNNYIVQLIGQDPIKMAKAVEIILEHISPVGFDLNFACPDKNIVKSGCGGFLMQNPELILEIIDAVNKVTNLPISVKTRTGWDNKQDIFKLAKRLEGKIEMLTVHGRTVKQGFGGAADWEVIGKLKAKSQKTKILIVGSGDINSWQEAIKIQKQTGADGVMIGRGALGKPWIFNEIKERKDYKPSIEEIKALALDLAKKSDSIWGNKGITEARKHFAWYFKGFPSAADYRKKLMTSITLEDVKKTLT